MSLNVGFLGYRFMGQAHANALARLPMFFPDAPDVERDVLIGRDEDALADRVEQLGFQRYATDWADVVDEVDVLYNLGPNDLHAEPSIAALESGTNVFCEKPLAHTLDAAERMADVAADSDATAGIAFNYRFIPAVQLARRLIDDGVLGEIHHFRGEYMQDWLVDPEAEWSWRNSAERAGSGALGDLGAHTIDLARFLVGDHAGEIEHVSGQLQTFVEERPTDGETQPVTVDDAYTATAEFESGAMGRFEASRFAEGHKNDHTFAIHGSKGSLRFSLERLNELELLEDGDRGYETILVTDEEDPYIDAWWPPGHVIGWEHTFVHENFEFLRSVSTGNEHRPNFDDGLAVQRVLNAIQQSDERGEQVTL